MSSERYEENMNERIDVLPEPDFPISRTWHVSQEQRTLPHLALHRVGVTEVDLHTYEFRKNA